MLATLIHSTLVSDSQTEKGEENRKHYQNLIKKLKKVNNFFKNEYDLVFNSVLIN